MIIKTINNMLLFFKKPLYVLSGYLHIFTLFIGTSVEDAFPNEQEIHVADVETVESELHW